MDSAQWLELFRSFPGVKALGVSGVLVRDIASALERAATGEAAKDMFPGTLRPSLQWDPGIYVREGWIDCWSEDDQIHDFSSV